MHISAQKITINSQKIAMKDHQVHINDINLKNPLFILQKDQPADSSSGPSPPSPVPDSTGLRWNSGHWNIRIDDINLNDGAFTLKKKDHPSEKYFDPD